MDAATRSLARFELEGLEYGEEFLTRDEEAALLGRIAALPLAAARYKEWTAKRRVVSYGGRYDFTDNELLPAAPIPAWLEPLGARAAEWAGVEPGAFEHALIAEYSPGTRLGWHRDVPQFELVAGVSLGGRARLRFRPYPHATGRRARTLAIELAPRSIYTLRGAARWRWQHAIAPTAELRYSITFRTLRVKPHAS